MRFEIVCPKKGDEKEEKPVRLYLSWLFGDSETPALMVDLQDGGRDLVLAAVLRDGQLYRWVHTGPHRERLRAAGFVLEAAGFVLDRSRIKDGLEYGEAFQEAKAGLIDFVLGQSKF